MRNAPAAAGTGNQLGTPVLSPAAQAWLQQHGAVFARMGADGVVEFSRRSLREALTDAALGLLPPTGKRSAAALAHTVPLTSLE